MSAPESFPDWLVVGCGCQVNWRTNETIISSACEQAIHDVWTQTIERAPEIAREIRERRNC